MKRGDVFKIVEEKQLYFVDDVTPSGTIFAHMFDLDKGVFGQPVSFPSNTEVEVLFNTFQPEEESGWEYCYIVHRLSPDKGYPNKEWFEAEAVISGGSHTVGKSKEITVLKGEPMLGYKTEESEAIQKKLVNDLIKNGWQIVHQQKNKWYEVRLKKKKKTINLVNKILQHGLFRSRK